MILPSLFLCRLASLGCLLASLGPSPAEPASATPGAATLVPRPAPADKGALRRAVRDAGTWLKRARKARKPLADEAEAELEAALSALELPEGLPPKDAERVLTVLFDLAGIGFGARDFAGNEPFFARARESVEAHLSGLLGERPEAVGERVQALLAGSDDDLPRRLAAVRLLRGRRLAEFLEPLTALANTAEAQFELRQAAFETLRGWPQNPVHEFFLQQLELGSEKLPDALLGVAVRHFAAVSAQLDDAARERLEAYIRAAVFDADWRVATRAIRLSELVPPQASARALVEALDAWLERQAEGNGSKRIEFELLLRLRRMSGRNLKARPEQWLNWLERVEAETLKFAEGENAEEELSEAGFFGLRPTSSRVVFVIDGSASMGLRNQRTGATRFAQATKSLLEYLEAAGTDTLFGVCIFNDAGRVWKPQLVPATAKSLGAVREWLGEQQLFGGSFLYQGLSSELLPARPDGGPDMARLEADTVVVLCDGAIEEPPAWGQSWLETYNRQAELVFQCVQIGKLGNGTLEILAEDTGGRFVIVNL